jgi:hypothetical protein
LKLFVELCYRHPDGSWSIEPGFYEGPTGAAMLAEARRDGVAGRFGREFEGICGVVRPTGRLDGLPKPRMASSDPRDPTRLAAQLSALRLVDLGDTAPEPALLAPAADVDAVPWYSLDAAFGPATGAGVVLRRCWAADEATAKAAAEEVGPMLCHEGTLYGATVAALPALARLVRDPRVAGRGALLALLADISASAVDGSGRKRKRDALIGLWLRWEYRHMPGMAADLLAAAARQRKHAVAIAAAWPSLALGPLGGPVAPGAATSRRSP